MPLKYSIADVGLGLIVAAYCLVVFSSPMPLQVGAMEIAMGAGLTLGALLIGYALAVRMGVSFKVPLSCVGYLLLVPLVVGMARGNSISNMVRDVAPLMFLTALPLLISLIPKDDNAQYRARAILIVIFSVGLIHAVQFHYGIVKLFGTMSTYIARYDPVLVESKDWVSWLGEILGPLGLVNLDYQMLMIKCQDPAVLFSAIYLMCLGLALILLRPRRMALGLLALGGGALCVYEFAALGMRAFSGLLIMALCIFVLHLIRSRKLPVVTLVVAGVVGVSLVYSQLLNFAAQMWAKSQANGLNGRPGELYAVFDSISESTYTFLFGIGWGGVLTNPIYNESATRFTHSLFSYVLLKTGLVGLTVMILFGVRLFRKVRLTDIWSSSHRLALFLAACGAIFVGLFLEPTYKMLSFGLIISLLLADQVSNADPK